MTDDIVAHALQSRTVEYLTNVVRQLREFVDRERAVREQQGKGGQTVGYSPRISPTVLKELERMLQP